MEENEQDEAGKYSINDEEGEDEKEFSFDHGIKESDDVNNVESANKINEENNEGLYDAKEEVLEDIERILPTMKRVKHGD